jgi:hypothetical protein
LDFWAFAFMLFYSIGYVLRERQQTSNKSGMKLSLKIKLKKVGEIKKYDYEQNEIKCFGKPKFEKQRNE